MGKYSFRDFITAKVSVHVNPDDLERFAQECDKYGAKLFFENTASQSLDFMRRHGYETFAVDKRNTRWIEFDPSMYGLPIVEFRDMEDVFPPCKPAQPAAPYDGRGKHKVGDRFKVVDNGRGAHPIFNIGDTVELSRDDGTDAPWFKPVGCAGTWACAWNRLEPIKAEPPKPERPKYKVGDLFKYVRKSPGHFDGYSVGDTVRMTGDETTNRPTFRRLSDNLCQNVFMNQLEPIQSAPEQKIIITHDGKTTYAKLYQDGKVVKEGKAVCSPDDKFDFEEGAALAMTRLINGKDASGLTTAELREWASDMERMSQKIFRVLQ